MKLLFLMTALLAQVMHASPLINAIEQVESGGNPLAVSEDGGALGPLQIRQCVVDDVNRHFKLKLRHVSALDSYMARVIFVRYLSIYATEERLGRLVTDRDRALIWRHGPDGWKRTESEYADRVQNLINDKA